MRETIQDKVNSWFVEKRNGETGEYPDFPDKEDGGSKVRRKRSGRPGNPLLACFLNKADFPCPLHV